MEGWAFKPFAAVPCTRTAPAKRTHRQATAPTVTESVVREAVLGHSAPPTRIDSAVGADSCARFDRTWTVARTALGIVATNIKTTVNGGAQYPPPPPYTAYLPSGYMLLTNLRGGCATIRTECPPRAHNHVQNLVNESLQKLQENVMDADLCMHGCQGWWQESGPDSLRTRTCGVRLGFSHGWAKFWGIRLRALLGRQKLRAPPQPSQPSSSLGVPLTIVQPYSSSLSTHQHGKVVSAAHVPGVLSCRRSPRLCGSDSAFPAIALLSGCLSRPLP